MKVSQLQDTDYLAYYAQYIKLNNDNTLLDALHRGLEETSGFFNAIQLNKQDYRYAPEKWTPKEILMHIIDTERVFVYRALTFARSEGAVLPGFDQDVFVENTDLTHRNIASLIEEYQATRQATIHFYKGLTAIDLYKKGKASGGDLSVAAAAFIIAGHEKHHCNIIKEHYL